MKVITKQTIENLRMIDQLKNEFNILRKLTHQNIIKLAGYFEDDRNIYFVLELADDDHLYAKLGKVEKYEEPVAAKYMFEMFQAVNYLHTQEPPIIHRDIKPENILFVNGVLKLADFGWSNMKENKARTTYCGTPDYLAPEMVLEKSHTEKLDVWTLGVLCFELVVGKAPFTPSATIKDRKMAQRELTKNIIEVKVKFPPHVSKTCETFIRRLLQKDYKNRPSCEEALQDPFFKTNGLFWTPPSNDSKLKTQVVNSALLISSTKLGDGTDSGGKLKKESLLEPTAVDSSTLSKSTTDPTNISSLLKKLPQELIDIYKQDQSRFLKEIVRAYFDLKDTASQYKQMIEVKNKALEKAAEEGRLEKKIERILGPDGKEITQDDVSSLFKKASELKVLKARYEESQEVSKKLEKDKDNLSRRVQELEQLTQLLRSEKELISADKQKLNDLVEDLKSCQLRVEQDWNREKEIMANSNKHMEAVLSNNHQTRPGVIQASLLKVIEMMEGINSFYLTRIKSTQAADDTEQVIQLKAENEELKRECQFLKGELDGKVKEAEENAKVEAQLQFWEQVDQYKLKRDSEVAALLKKIDLLQSQIGETALLEDQIRQLRQLSEDKDKLVALKTSTEAILRDQIRRANEEIGDYGQTLAVLTLQIEGFKAQITRNNTK